jgi:serine protease inhibitor
MFLPYNTNNISIYQPCWLTLLKSKTTMSTTEQLSQQRLQLLSEALEMLEDMKIKMALFERQHYSKLKARVEKMGNKELMRSER